MIRRAAISSVVLLLAGFTVSVAKPAGALVPPAPLLAYARYQAVRGASSIYTAHLDGSGAASLISNATRPVLSPDARRIAFTRGSQLWVADADGRNQVSVTSGVVNVGWSPDATRLVGERPGGLAIVSVATHAVTPIPDSAGEWAPQWSPDGTLIASTRNLRYSGGAAQPELDQVLRRPDGSSRVVRNGVFTGPWSPDGEHMLFVGFEYVYVIDVVSGASIPAFYIRPSIDYAGVAWQDFHSVDTGSVSAYIGVDYDVPYAPEEYSLDSVAATMQPDPNPGSYSTLVAANSLYPTVGGFTTNDANGPPPPVTGLTASTSPSYVHLSWSGPASTPDFAGVEIRYALGDTPPATVSDGLDGGRLLTTSRDLGPLPPDQSIAISVFSRDWTRHIGPAATAVVTTPHAAASTLTAHAAPFDLAYPTRSTVSGSLLRAYDTAPIPNATIAVATRVWGTTGPFLTRGSVRTDANGRFSFVQAPAISYDYRLTYAGDVDNATVTAATRIRVAHRVAERLDRTLAPAGTYVHLTATPLPALPNGKTYLQTYTTRAVTLGPHNTDSSGRVIYTIRVPAKGKKATYRVYVPGTGGYINGQGPWLTITGT